MLTTIQGTYSNGVVVLNEEPPTTKTSKVLITFTDVEVTNATLKEPVKVGFGKGTVIYMAQDFNAPIDDIFDCMK